MTIPERITQFLKHNHVYYQIHVHPKINHCSEIADFEDASPYQVAKVVMAKDGRRNIMLVLPADHTVDLLKLSSELGSKNVRIEEEKEFRPLFPDCEAGTMPPFGMLYDLRYYIDKSIAQSTVMYFKAGTSRECLEIATADFLRLVKGHVMDFAVEGQKIKGAKVSHETK